MSETTATPIEPERNPIVNTYDDLNIWHHFRIAEFMHAIFNLHGRNRDALKKAAEDCAGWYYTDVNAIVKVWHEHFPDDLRVEIDNNSEGVEAP